MHQREDLTRHEAVVDEEVFLDAERSIAALEIAGSVVLHAMPQREILGPRRRPDRIGLHETQPFDGAFQRRRPEETGRDRIAAKIGEGHYGSLAFARSLSLSALIQRTG